MTLVCRPPGRGNWHTVVITIRAVAYDLERAARFAPGQRFTWGEPPMTLRIVEVRT